MGVALILPFASRMYCLVLGSQPAYLYSNCICSVPLIFLPSAVYKGCCSSPVYSLICLWQFIQILGEGIIACLLFSAPAWQYRQLIWLMPGCTLCEKKT